MGALKCITQIQKYYFNILETTKWYQMYKPGGTVTITRQSYFTKIIDSESDLHKLERWSYIIIQGIRSTKKPSLLPTEYVLAI